jgi:hypothetical protein
MYGFDMAGDEAGFPVAAHIKPFSLQRTMVSPVPVMEVKPRVRRVYGKYSGIFIPPGSGMVSAVRKIQPCLITWLKKTYTSRFVPPVIYKRIFLNRLNCMRPIKYTGMVYP